MKKILPISILKISLVLSFLIGIFHQAQAAGPVSFNLLSDDGHHGHGRIGFVDATVPYNLAGFNQISNCNGFDTRAILSEAIEKWSNVENTEINFVQGEDLIITEDNIIDITNAFFNNNAERNRRGDPSFIDGLNPVIIDADQELLSLIGVGSNIFGLAGITNYDEKGQALESFAIVKCPEDSSREEILRIVTHELGHYIGLGHSKVNGSVALQGTAQRLSDTTGPEPYELYELIPISPFLTLDNHIEMMYPFQVDGITEEMNQITSDDKASLALQYPSENASQETATIRGFVYDIDGKTPLTGVNVIARNISDPYADAVSNMTSTIRNPGEFVLTHLKPNEEYVVFTDNARFTRGRFSIPFQFGNEQVPEEFWNGDGESSDPETDKIDEFETITLSAGEVRTGINFFKNASIPQPGEALNFSSSNPSATIPLDFDFEFCGVNYSMVTFGSAGVLSFTHFDNPFLTILGKETFLSRRPMISALSNVIGGDVSYQSSPEKFVVQWERGTDLTSITLLNNGVFYITYDTEQDPNRVFGLSGYTCGPSFVSLTEPQTDLYNPSASGAFLDFFRQETSTINDLKNTETLTLADLNQNTFKGNFTSNQSHSDSFSLNLSLEGENLADNVKVINSRQKTAVYEMYGSPSFVSEKGFTPFDLNPEGGLSLVFLPPGPFNDHLEPNNSLATATPIRLPFNSGINPRRQTRLEQFDVDYYQFCGGKPGEHLIAEFQGPFNEHGPSLTYDLNTIDGVFALFDDQGKLLKLDRESGTPGSFNSFPRIAYPITENSPRCYKLAVTTEGANTHFDYFNLIGHHPVESRYIIDIRTVKGEPVEFNQAFRIPISLYTEIELPFSFPFYGNSYSSVFVGSQGDLTFGEIRNSQHQVNMRNLLDGPPTIAALWDSVLLSGRNVFAGDSFGRTRRGVILAREEDDGTFTIEYKNTGSKFSAERVTFSINLREDGQILLNYPDVEEWSTIGRGHFVGISPGGGVEEPEESDVSEIQNFTINEQAIIEFFDPEIREDQINKRIDLHGTTIRFMPE